MSLILFCKLFCKTNRLLYVCFCDIYQTFILTYRSSFVFWQGLNFIVFCNRSREFKLAMSCIKTFMAHQQQKLPWNLTAAPSIRVTKSYWMSSSLTRTKMLKLLVAMQMELLRVQFNLQVVCSGSEDSKSLVGLIYRERVNFLP